MKSLQNATEDQSSTTPMDVKNKLEQLKWLKLASKKHPVQGKHNITDGTVVASN